MQGHEFHSEEGLTLKTANTPINCKPNQICVVQKYNYQYMKSSAELSGQILRQLIINNTLI